MSHESALRAFPRKRAAVLALLAGYLAALCSMPLTGWEAFGAVTYQSDTKGYYQPVYRFEVMQGEAPIAEVRIPALQ